MSCRVQARVERNSLELATPSTKSMIAIQDRRAARNLLPESGALTTLRVSPVLRRDDGCGPFPHAPLSACNILPPLRSEKVSLDEAEHFTAQSTCQRPGTRRHQTGTLYDRSRQPTESCPGAAPSQRISPLSRAAVMLSRRGLQRRGPHHLLNLCISGHDLLQPYTSDNCAKLTTSEPDPCVARGGIWRNLDVQLVNTGNLSGSRSNYALLLLQHCCFVRASVWKVASSPTPSSDRQEGIA